MLMKLILIGRLKDKSLEEHCQEYLRRLRAYGKVETVVLPDSDPGSEAKLIRRELDRDRGAEIIVLGEEGREYTTVELSKSCPPPTGSWSSSSAAPTASRKKSNGEAPGSGPCRR